MLGSGRLLGRCVSKGHSDRTASLVIYTDTQTFKCYGCQAWGDVIALEMIAGGHDSIRDALMALMARYQVPVRERPASWRRWQDHKGRVREAAKKHVATVYQRRLTRAYAPLVLVGGESPLEQLEVLEELAQALWPVSLDLAGKRIAGE